MINIYIETGIKLAQKNGKETTNELDFLAKFILHHFPEKQYHRDFEILGIGGKDSLAQSASYIALAKAKGDVNLIIFDADTLENGGGFSNRKDKIIKAQQDNGLNVPFFLWPNNHDDGDFESLLLGMINQEHKGLLECYEGYEMCVSGKDPEEKSYNRPNRKGAIHSYISTMKKTRAEKELFSKGYWLFDDSRFWNLDADAGKPLKEFLSTFF